MDWLNNLIDFLKNDGVAITAVATVVIAVFTIVLVIFNIKSFLFTRKMSTSTHRPKITMYYRGAPCRDGKSFVVYLFVQNEGNGPAYNITFDYKYYEFPQEGFSKRTLDDIGFLRDGISILEQGGQKVEIAFSGEIAERQFYFKKEEKTTEITVKYKDLGKVLDKETLTINFSNTLHDIFR